MRVIIAYPETPKDLVDLFNIIEPEESCKNISNMVWKRLKIIMIKDWKNLD
jgi:hypothetical protein